MNRWGASVETFDDAASAPLRKINFARPIRVELRERGLEARRHQQELQVRLAAVLQEVLHRLIGRHAVHDLRFGERARVVLVDHQETFSSGVEELGREGLDLRAVRRLRLLALDAALLELGLEGQLDGLLPLHGIDLARSIGIKRLQRRLEARRHQQVLEVRVAAVVQESNNFLVIGDGIDDLLLRERAGLVLVNL